MDKFIVRSSTLLLALGISLGAQAEPLARLSQVEGQVLINQGKQYVSAQRGVALQRGDRILVLANSSALLTYTGECTLRLGPNQLLTVDSLEQCRQAAVSGNTPGLVAAAAVNAKMAGFAAGAGDPVIGGLTTEALAVIVGGTVAIGAVIYDQTGGGDGGGGGGGGEISPD